METAQHTEGILTCTQTGIADERGDMLLTADLGDHRIESVGRLWNTHGRAKVNGERIVKAWNLYDDLVKALTDALALMEQQEVRIEGEWGCGRTLEQLEAVSQLSDEIIQARAILAKATKGESLCDPESKS